MMWGLPWGFILLMPLAWLLFRNRGRRLVRELGFSPRGLLWYIFFLLLGGFITLNAAAFYVNMGGVAALLFALRLLMRLNPWQLVRALLSALGSGIFCYAFLTGRFWWLARLPLATDWLLPLVMGLLAALLAVTLASSLAGLILGALGGHAAALLYLNAGRLAVELGSVAALNNMLLGIFFALLFALPLSRLTLSPP